MNKPIQLDFDTLKEDWNWYSLKDETRIKVKLIVVNVIKSDSTFDVNTEKVFGVVSPPDKMGLRTDQRHSQEELSRSIIEDDLDFSTIKEDWNSYKLPDGTILKAKLALTKVSKTSKYDHAGDPFYVFQSAPLFKILKPKNSS